jgi:Ca-activated chloride channel family protein
MGQDFYGMQRGAVRDDLRREITDLGLQYRLMTQFTSFVAVEETTITEGGKARRVEVPVEMPEGMSYEGVFGRESRPMPATMAMNAQMSRSSGFAGIVGGLSMRKMAPAPAPAAKLDPSLTALLNHQPVRDEPVQVQNGKVSVQLYLNDASPETIRQLQQFGFEIVIRPKSGNVLVGRVAIDKLQALSQMNAIKYVASYRL